MVRDEFRDYRVNGNDRWITVEGALAYISFETE
jgi:hypothetical protein